MIFFNENEKEQEKGKCNFIKKKKSRELNDTL